MAIEYCLRCDQCRLRIEGAFGSAAEVDAARERFERDNRYRRDGNDDLCMICYNDRQRRRGQHQHWLELIAVDRIKRPWSHAEHQAARREHALMLHCEGLSKPEIAHRLGLPSPASAIMLVYHGCNALAAAMQGAKWKVEPHREHAA